MSSALIRSSLAFRCLMPCLHTTSVRWKRREPLRKHIWQPQAPSKLFRIPEKKYLPRDEQQQLDLLRWNFEADLLSIKTYCRKHFYLPSREAGGLTPEQVKAEEEQHLRRLQENARENQRTAAARAQRESRQRQARLEELTQREQLRQKQDEDQRREANELVSREVKRSASFITKENLLSAIEDALRHPVSYDFAIDRSGNVVTDGKIHVQAFTPSALPETLDNASTMVDDVGTRLTATKLY